MKKPWVSRATYAKNIAAVRLAVQHIEHLFLGRLAGRVSFRPVVSGALATLALEHIFGVVQMPVLACHNIIDHPRLEVDQHRAGDIVVVVRLVKEHVFAVVCTLLLLRAAQRAILRDTVLLTQTLPEL